MKNLPTAKEFYLKTLFPKTYIESPDEVELWFNTSRHSNQDVAMMIEFAKLHVEEALKEASDKLYDTYHTVCEDGTTKGVFKTQEEALNFANTLNNTTNLYHDWVKVVRLDGGMGKSSILNSYPLDKIK